MKQGVRRKDKNHSTEMEGKQMIEVTQYILEGFPTEYLKLFGKGCGEVRKSLKCVPRIQCGGGGARVEYWFYERVF